jgi:hypothetical protein
MTSASTMIVKRPTRATIATSYYTIV